MPSDERTLRDLPLAELPAATWRLLDAGVASARDSFHTPSLATFGDRGPEQRTVVLRFADAALRSLGCHTDARSPKIRQVLTDPRSSWLFYDHDRKLQLRLLGRLTVHTHDALADGRWADSRAMSRACYNTDLSPGAAVTEPPPAPGEIARPDEERIARSRFAVLACEVSHLDWLCLDARGHRRARLEWRAGEWHGEWVAP
jgi:pyridoxamine 5'-phosphate oxidase